ncbi:ABC transporter ATP-binding protein [Faecalibacillus intestinalis]|uniref:ABC transporter ATP-binding protein n=1 Tax=Faecalibacillus intestinalis TaxID=1982626 RepID=UPI0018AAC024|nr:ABC transporter ATP-binding protein [Faecalibacillus intestinalis]
MTTIECKNLSFKYEQDYVLSNIDFKLKTNSLYVLKGDNGSGKTTLCKILTGLYDNYEGEIYLENRDIKKMNRDELLNLIFYSAQLTPVFSDTLSNNIFLDSKITKEQENKYFKMIKFFSLDELEEKEIIDDGSVSGGQKQKIGILRALFSNKEILIFDEPTANLDKQSIKKLVMIIKKLKETKLIIVISHDNTFDCIASEIIKI